MKTNRLVTADLHLTDAPADEYRWSIFDTLTQLAVENRVDEIYILGDLVDRKDRHSGLLVNRLVDSLETTCQDTGAEITITEGNHDAPLNGPPYWSFLSSLNSVDYVTEPTFDMKSEIWLLPFAANPADEWRELDFNKAKFIFMHQTVAGSMVDNDRILTDGCKMPLLPRGIPIVSGDVHRPQQVGAITYVGAPYPVRFSETWKNRVLLLKDRDVKEIYIHSVKKAILDVTNTSQLPTNKYHEGDQLRVRFKLSHEQMTQWPVEQAKIYEWAKLKGVTVVSVEAILDDKITSPTTQKIESLELLKPDEVIKTFSQEEKLGDDVMNFGIQIMREAMA